LEGFALYLITAALGLVGTTIVTTFVKGKMEEQARALREANNLKIKILEDQNKNILLEIHSLHDTQLKMSGDIVDMKIHLAEIATEQKYLRDGIETSAARTKEYIDVLKDQLGKVRVKE
jgi:hypothetical protein